METPEAGCLGGPHRPGEDTMGFSVDIAALGGLPRQLDRLGEDAAAGRDYVDRYTQLGLGEGIINLVLGGHREATKQVSQFFRTLGSAAQGQSKGLNSALASYRSTDLAAAAAFDAKLPASDWPPRDRHVNSFSFADRDEPQDTMTPPPDYSGEYRFEMKWHSYLSPTSHVRNVIWEATGLAAKLGIGDRPIDVFVEWLKPWLGDWAGFRACADVHQNLAAASVTMGVNVLSGSLDSEFVWNGNAANASRHDLAIIGDALNLANTKLNELSAEYRSVAENTYKLAEAVAGLVVVAADIAAMALLELTAAMGGGLGAAMNVGMAVGKIWQIIEIGMKILDCIKIAESGAKAFTAGIDGFSVIDPKGPLPSLASAGTPSYGPPTGGHGRAPAYT
jgi:hypothetical protein